MIDTYSDISESNIIENTEPEKDLNMDNLSSNDNLPVENEIDEPTINNQKEEIFEIKPEDIFGFGGEQTNELPEEETPEDNQVISVDLATNLDLDLIHAKANKVMKRVGEMLGIKTEETKIVSVTAEEEKVEAPIEESAKETDSELSAAIPNNPLPDENPLFNNNIAAATEEPNALDEEHNFWFPSDMPDALNALPDLEVSNDNFFTNNTMPDLSFPDLKIDFGPNDSEEK